ATVRAQLVLSGAVFFVLLIAAVNLSGLFLARVIGRLRELAVRTALGAGRRRQLQQAVVESVLVGAIGGALGVVLAAAGLWFLGVNAPERFGGVQPLGCQLATFCSPGLDWRVILFGVLLSMIAALVAGLIPAFWGTRRDLTRALRTGARGSSVGVGSLRRPTVLSAVAVVQMAFALVLLTG